MIVKLATAQRKSLKARAHRLEPVVMVGDKGLTDAVLKEIDVNLKSHELIKVRVASDDRDERESYLARICEALDAAAVQHIGKILVVYREKPVPPPAPPAPARRKPVRATGQRRVSAARPAATKRAPRPARSR